MSNKDNRVSKKVQGYVAGAGIAVGGVYTAAGNGMC
jgi:hypothetical protein